MVSSINLNTLNVIQNQLRNTDQICEMIRHVERGGLFHYTNLLQFNKGQGKSDLIEIAYFKENNSYYVHNGHHRCVAIWLGGRNYLGEGEYYIKPWRFDYRSISFSVGYVTPFDPLTEARLPDFSQFKKTVIELDRVKNKPGEALQYIRDNKHLYCEKKIHFTVPELAKTYLNIQCNSLITFTQEVVGILPVAEVNSSATF
jgi:hypothetical protein